MSPCPPRFLRLSVLVLLTSGLTSLALAAESPQAACTLENESLRLVLGSDGRVQAFLDPRSGQNYLASPAEAVARIRLAGKSQDATAASYADGKLSLTFGDTGVQATLRPQIRPHYLVFEVLDVQGPALEEFVFANVALSLRGTPEEPFAACALALNLKTNVIALPQASSRLQATCYPRFGLAGAQVALIGCPQAELRRVLQEVVTEAEELPKSPLGGPWALGQAINQGSYLFNFGDLSLDKVDKWIALCQRLGINQIDFHTGSSLRFGDCRPNPKTYPEGYPSVQAVLDRLHAAGISAGLHTYAFFLAKDSQWVSPVPDPRLAKDAQFTLAEALPAEGDRVAVAESTDKMSTTTGFFVRNSVTLQIDDELITYTGIAKEAPFAFTGCKRGACGTKVAAHAAGAKVAHLKECFGLFVPDPETTLFQEVAAKTAEAFNRCGFDMIYLDALDGEDILGGPENAWHYGSSFVYEIWKRLERPALMEMSTFHHHLWAVRSRLGAWDHPARSHKRFIDLHCEGNRANQRMFLPSQLGWWAFKTWTNPQGEPTFPDDIEYLMAKCLGTDTGFALMGIDPSTVNTVPALPRLADITRRYETLRHSGQVPEAIKAKLREPGAEYTLEGSLEQGWQFRPVKYDKHKVLAADDPTSSWRVENSFEAQPVRLRIEALMGAEAYDSPASVPVVTFGSEEHFSAAIAEDGVRAQLQPSQDQIKTGDTSGCYRARNDRDSAVGAWSQVGLPFEPPKDLHQQQALGVWVYGDGQQEILNLQLRSPEHIAGGLGDHYVPIDFRGWHYFELIEPEGEAHSRYTWPYGSQSHPAVGNVSLYSIYREEVSFRALEKLALWYNHLPPGQDVTCYLSPIRAMPLAKLQLQNPVVSIGGQAIRFPTAMESGSYLELLGPQDCKLYGPKGELLAEVTPEGAIPTLQADDNEVRFTCGEASGRRARARVTVISQGPPLR